MRRLFLLLACALPLLAAGCDSSSTGATSVEDTNFASALGIDLSAMTRVNANLYYRDITVGSGALAQSGNSVSVHYKGWLSNGTLFQQSQQPFPFALGTGYVIPGWDQGVPGMRVGGKRLLVIGPSLAYGTRGSGPIPPNAVIVFEVELLSAQ
jgi:FKBP-type peptidyl-prolyl cis-trans isomerase FkpA